MNVYLRAKCQVSNVSLTSFRQVGVCVCVCVGGGGSWGAFYPLTNSPPPPAVPQNEPLESSPRLWLTKFFHYDIPNVININIFIQLFLFLVSLSQNF